MDTIEKIKENQKVSSMDVLSIVFCFALVIGVSLIIFKNHIDMKRAEVAKNYAENLAQEIAMKPVISSQGEGGRVPASVVVNQDPWGREYSTTIVHNSYGQPIYIVVLSAGPDGQFETQIQPSMAVSQSQIQNLKIIGDDVGYIKSYR